MSLLREIQSGLLKEPPDLGTILLKLRLLAAHLGSEDLEDWVRFEAEGYPREVEVPEYRVVGVSYSANFFGPFGNAINNAPIAPYFIEKFAGKDWTTFKVRESISSVQAMTNKEDGLGFNANNLALMLRGNVYPDYECASVRASISVFSVQEVVSSVRSRILELTIALEKRLPDAVKVTLQSDIQKEPDQAEAVRQIFNQIIMGNVTHVTASGSAVVALNFVQGDASSMQAQLTERGLPAEAAKEITDIIASEEPESAEAPLGHRALEWIKTNAPKAAGGAWKIGSAVLTDLIKEAAMRYYGLK